MELNEIFTWMVDPHERKNNNPEADKNTFWQHVGVYLNSPWVFCLDFSDDRVWDVIFLLGSSIKYKFGLYVEI